MLIVIFVSLLVSRVFLTIFIFLGEEKRKKSCSRVCCALFFLLDIDPLPLELTSLGFVLCRA